jgi:hypothetical protein
MERMAADGKTTEEKVRGGVGVGVGAQEIVWGRVMLPFTLKFGVHT